jgi:hypothetical protein
MTGAEDANTSLIRSYLAAIESGATGEALARFFTPDAIQVELPNRLNPQGGAERVERHSGARRASGEAADVAAIRGRVGDSAGFDGGGRGVVDGYARISFRNACGGRRTTRSLRDVLRARGRSNKVAAQLRLLRAVVVGRSATDVRNLSGHGKASYEDEIVPPAGVLYIFSGSRASYLDGSGSEYQQ